MKELTDNMIRELAVMCTRNETGQHYTVWSDHYLVLEELGLIKINRPVHESTGTLYDIQYWTVEVTEEGQNVVDANPELCPD